MATGQLCYNVRLSDGSMYSTPGIDDSNFFTSNIVDLAGVSKFIKLGVQAPPGTKIVLNTSRTIMIGRTGIYELETKISDMRIIRLKNYIPQTQKETDAKREGLLGWEDNGEHVPGIIETVGAWNNYLQDLDVPISGPEWPINDAQLVERQEQYAAAYATALQRYMLGYNGIYDQDQVKPYVDVENIIIDYQYE